MIKEGKLSKTTYKKELAVLEHVAQVFDNPESVDFKAEYQKLSLAYEKLFNITRRLVSMSDKKEQHLKKANATIKEQGETLTRAHEQLSIHALRLEEKIQEFEAIFNNSSAGVALLSPDGVLYRGNARLMELLECSEEELLGQRLDAFFVREDTCSLPDKGPCSFLKAGETVRFERQLRSLAGRTFWGSLAGNCLNPNDLNAGLIWIIDDVTSRKELEKLREDVERIMRHDLKGPLDGVINLPDLILEDGGLNEYQRELLDHISHAGKLMLNQINMSCDLYKMETGGYVFTPKPVNLSKVVKDAARDLSSKAAALGVRIEMRFNGSFLGAGERIVAAGDELLCYNMISNILKNAIEASSTGDIVTLRLDLEEEVRLIVHNPAAIPAEVRPIFFQKYATYGKRSGSGLGAYSARLMALAQGGAIAMETDEQRGTTIVCSMPRFQA